MEGFDDDLYPFEHSDNNLFNTNEVQHLTWISHVGIHQIALIYYNSALTANFDDLFPWCILQHIALQDNIVDDLIRCYMTSFSK